MKTYSHILIAVLVSVLLTGCYSNRAIGLLQERDDLPQYTDTVYEHYRIRLNDEIVYRLITMDETISKAMQGSSASSASSYDITGYRVYPDGTIELPFLEPIHVLGLTVPEAEAKVEAAFKEIIPDAEVKLTLANKTFTVIGDASSGVYQIYKDRLTIYQALAMTGDLFPQGDRRHVRIIRPRDNADPEVLEFDIRTNTIIDSKYYYIYPNDVIYVARSKGSFYKVASYSAFLGLITSSLSLLISVLNYSQMFYKK